MRFIHLFYAIIGASVLFAAQEMVNDQDLNYTGSNGSIGLQHKGTVLNWTQGALYRRLEVKEKPTDHNAGNQLCVWNSDYLSGESCSPCITFTKVGVYYIRTEPKTWWCNQGKCPNYNAYGHRAYCLKAEGCGGKWLANCSGGHCYGSAALQHTPIKLHVTEYYVPSGETFECPEGWNDAPWEGCESTRTARASFYDGSKAIRFNIERTSGGYIRFHAPGARKITLFSLRGDQLFSASCSAEGTCSFPAMDRSATACIVVFQTQTGAQAHKRILMH